MENNTTGIITAEQAAEAAKGLTFEKVWAALMETRQRMDESQKRAEESRMEYEKQVAESRNRADELNEQTQKRFDEVERQIGRLGNSIGDLAESMFSGSLWDKFDEYGIHVASQSVRKSIRDENKKLIAEIDVFIENGEYAIPVEIKTKLTMKDVDEHIKRIEVIRGYFDKKGDNRKLLGAIAAGVFTQNALKYAHDCGLFVLVQSGDSVTIADTPQGFKAREW